MLVLPQENEAGEVREAVIKGKERILQPLYGSVSPYFQLFPALGSKMSRLLVSNVPLAFAGADTKAWRPLLLAQPASFVWVLMRHDTDTP